MSHWDTRGLTGDVHDVPWYANIVGVAARTRLQRGGSATALLWSMLGYSGLGSIVVMQGAANVLVEMEGCADL
jgi:hypothetical protein